MKRIVSVFVLCCLLLFVLPFSASAEDGRVEVRELGFSLEFPEDMVVFTRDIDPNDPNLSDYGLTRDGVLSMMKDSNMYLNAWDREVNTEITVTVAEAGWPDFNDSGDALIVMMLEALKDGYQEAGVQWKGADVRQCGSMTLGRIRISIRQNGSVLCGTQYIVSREGKCIIFTVKFWDEKLMAEAEAMMERSLATLQFDDDPEQTPPPTTPAFLYQESGSGVSFTVPANWRSKEASSSWEYIDAIFMNDRAQGESIIFAADDVWFGMLAEGLDLADRSEINNSLFTEADIAEALSTIKGTVIRTRIRGVEYFRIDGVSQGTAFGLAVSAPVTCLIRYENGYAYMFMFGGGKDSEWYDDFIDLICSVKYPEAKPAPSQNSGTGSAVKPLPTKEPDSAPTPRPTRSPVAFGSSEWESLFVLNIILSLILTVTVYSLPIIIYRYAIRKKPMEAKKARRVVILYAIGAFIVMAALLILINGTPSVGGAIFLWSWINYKMLTGGADRTPMKREEEAVRLRNLAEAVKAEKAASDSGDAPDETAEPPRAAFCRKCGKPVDTDGAFCRYCGAKID